MKSTKYEIRIVAFIDILGFKNILNDTMTKDNSYNQRNINNIVSAIKSIREVWDMDETKYKKYITSEGVIKNSKKRITMFSDCVLISFPYKEPSQVFETLLELQWMIMRLVKHKIICRGGIAVERVIHNSKVMFGPAIVEAYSLENKSAKYPRVILSKEVIKLGTLVTSHNTPEQEEEHINDIVTQDEDGYYYIDYFQKAQDELDDPQYEFPEYLYNLYLIIKTGLEQIEPGVKEKYEWMKRKYNHVIKLYKDPKFIQSLKSSGEDELSDAYLDLRELL